MVMTKLENIGYSASRSKKLVVQGGVVIWLGLRSDASLVGWASHEN